MASCQCVCVCVCVCVLTRVAQIVTAVQYVGTCNATWDLDIIPDVLPDILLPTGVARGAPLQRKS